MAETGDHPISEHNPRAMYSKHLAEMRDSGRITHAQFFQRLDKYDRKHCAKFNSPDSFARMGDQRSRIMEALSDKPEGQQR